MPRVRLLVRDVAGEREVVIDTLPCTVGRRDGNDLRLPGGEVSREHAELLVEQGRLFIVDRGSRYGTFVNDEPVTRCVVRTGDRIRLGRGGGAELIVRESLDDGASTRSSTGPRHELRQVSALLEGVQALGSGRVLQDVLELVLDASLDVSGAERGFIMLADADGALELRLARGRQRKTLTDATFATSRKIPEEVFRTGETRVVVDLMDAELASAHSGTVALGIRHVVCVPLNYVHYVESADARVEDRRIGVVYLDSRGRGRLASASTLRALETLAGEASVAIENARLYREKLEKVRLESEMRIAADIQRALMPKPCARLAFAEAAATSEPCRSIGGDFFDYHDERPGVFSVALGDVAGKGPPAALLGALVQGMFASLGVSGTPAGIVTGINRALCRRGIEARFVTMALAHLSEDGTLTSCNGGHNPPFVIGRDGVRRLERGGPPVGLLEPVTYEEETVRLEPGDLVVLFSDGVPEAIAADDEEFGEARLLEIVQAGRDLPVELLVQQVTTALHDFTAGAPQSDDVTVMVVRYLGAPAAV